MSDSTATKPRSTAQRVARAMLRITLFLVAALVILGIASCVSVRARTQLRYAWWRTFDRNGPFICSYDSYLLQGAVLDRPGRTALSIRSGCRITLRNVAIRGNVQFTSEGELEDADSSSTVTIEYGSIDAAGAPFAIGPAGERIAVAAVLSNSKIKGAAALPAGAVLEGVTLDGAGAKPALLARKAKLRAVDVRGPVALIDSEATELRVEAVGERAISVEEGATLKGCSARGVVGIFAPKGRLSLVGGIFEGSEAALLRDPGERTDVAATKFKGHVYAEGLVDQEDVQRKALLDERRKKVVAELCDSKLLECLDEVEFAGHVSGSLRIDVDASGAVEGVTYQDRKRGDQLRELPRCLERRVKQKKLVNYNDQRGTVICDFKGTHLRGGAGTSEVVPLAWSQR